MGDIKCYRKIKRLTQAELGKMVGLSRFSISAYEKGEQSPTVETLVKIANVLDAPLSELFEGLFGIEHTKIEPIKKEGSSRMDQICMTPEEKEQIKKSLIGFVCRASAKDASPAEIELLPEVTRLTFQIFETLKA